MALTPTEVWIGITVFVVAAALYTVFFWWAMDQTPATALGLSIAPAAISVAALLWANRKESSSP